MPDIKASAKKALGGAAASAAKALAAIKKKLAIPTIPPFPEIAINIKSLISVKLIKAAIKKKIDAVKDILDPTKIKDQLSGDKKTGIIASITPRQVKDLVKAAKEGSKLTPKEAITGTLEKFTGVSLDQDNLLQSLGGAVLDSIKSQISALKDTFMQTVVGCINKAVRDLLNKFPTLDFLINLEDRLNGILGKFRNQLEQKIDAELRGLMYQKIKIHQLTLFKQSLHGSIRSICPEATPASSAEVKAFMDSYEEGKKKREEANKVKDTKNQIDDQSPATPKVPTPASVQDSLSERVRRDMGKSDYRAQVANQAATNGVNATQRTIAKGQAVSNNTVSSIVSSQHRLPGGTLTYVFTGRRTISGRWQTEEEKKQNKELAARIDAQVKANANFKGSTGTLATVPGVGGQWSSMTSSGDMTDWYEKTTNPAPAVINIRDRRSGETEKEYQHYLAYAKAGLDVDSVVFMGGGDD